MQLSQLLNGLSRGEAAKLAELSGVAPSTISRIINLKRGKNPSHATVTKIEAGLKALKARHAKGKSSKNTVLPKTARKEAVR